jgi:hypothetical protein
MTSPKTDRDPLLVLDEHAFMKECAARMNAFIQTYPEEAQHVLRAFIPYQHELVEVHKAVLPPGSKKIPGVTFGAMYAAVLQTHHGVGYYLYPVVEEDPDDPRNGEILRLEVRRQGPEEDGDDPSN